MGDIPDLSRLSQPTAVSNDFIARQTTFESAAEFVLKNIFPPGTPMPWPLYLLDGSNLLFQEEGKPNRIDFKSYNEMREKMRYAGGQGTTLVVISRATYRMITNGDDCSNCFLFLRNIAKPGTKVSFIVIGLDKCTNFNQDRCIKYDYDVKPKECSYIVNGRRGGKSHLLCEYDDVLLSTIDAYLRKEYKWSTMVISKDDGVVKGTPEVEDATRELRRLGYGVEIIVEQYTPEVEEGEIVETQPLVAFLSNGKRKVYDPDDYSDNRRIRVK